MSGAAVCDFAYVLLADRADAVDTAARAAGQESTAREDLDEALAPPDELDEEAVTDFAALAALLEQF